jgi:hypothetical protein
MRFSWPGFRSVSFFIRGIGGRGPGVGRLWEGGVGVVRVFRAERRLRSLIGGFGANAGFLAGRASGSMLTSTCGISRSPGIPRICTARLILAICCKCRILRGIFLTRGPALVTFI